MKKLLYLIALITFLSNAQEKLNYSKVKILYNSTEDFNRLKNLEIPLDHGIHKKDTYFISFFSSQEVQKIKNAGFITEVIIEDVETDFLERNKANTTIVNTKNLSCSSNEGPIEYQTPSNFELGSMGGYLTYQEMLDNLDAMHSLYPNIISARSDIGSFTTTGTPDNSTTPSIGGNKLQWVKISDNPDVDEDEPEVLYDAIHHAREPASLSQLIFYMWYLLENYDSDPIVKQIVDNTELYFVPVVNPDGYLYNQKTYPNGGGMWRKNRNNTYGTDLNRNYDYYPNGDPSSSVWGGQGTSTNTSNDVYAGTGPFSEVETQAMKWFVEQHEFSVALNNHTFGDLLLYPFGYESNKPTVDDNFYKAISGIMVSQNGYSNIISSGLYPAAGDSDDFMYGTIGTHNKIIAFTPEIGDSFWPSSNEIIGICKEMTFLNLTAAKLAGNYAKVVDETNYNIGSNLSFNASYSIENIGVSGNGNFEISIIPVSNNIESVGSSKSYTGLTFSNATEDQIMINLKNSITNGEDVIYKIELNTGAVVETFEVIKKFGEVVALVDNNADNLSDFETSTWSTTSSTYVSGVSSITDSPGGNYSSNISNSIALSNAVDLSDAITANIEFYAKWDIENNYDYVQLQISENDGASWIPQCGKYTNAGSSNAAQPTGEPLYDGIQSDWIKEEINLSDYLGKVIKIRFVLRSDQNTEGDGFYFDDLKVNIIKDEPLSVDDFEEITVSLHPNPTEGKVYFNFEDNNTYKAEVFNTIGQRILSTEVNNEKNTIDLSAYNKGIYFVKIYDRLKDKTFKIIKH